MDTGLAGKTVFLTGAASGIGRATAEAFALEDACLGLIDLDRDGLRDLERSLNRADAAAFIQSDLSTPNGVASGIRSVIDALGPPDVLVNNVGAGSVRTFDDLSDEDWQETMELNFYSCVRAIRAVLPAMRERGSGVIINNSSDLGRQPEPNPLDYSVSKAAILTLTKALARSEGPAIRVNAVAPGPIWTPFWTKPGGFADTLAELHGMPPQDAVEHEMKLRQIPLQRLGRPEEVANVIVFLASDRASFVTSSVYGVDGGSIRGLA